MSDQIENILNICESNARSTEANAAAIGELSKDFRGWLTLMRDISDDQGVQLDSLEESSEDHDAHVTALRADAIADRQSAAADRKAFQEALLQFRADSDERFAAQQEVIATLLAELTRTNIRVVELERKAS